MSTRDGLLPASVDIGATLDDGPFTTMQRCVVLLAALAIVLDGFDGQLIGFAIPVLIREWGITRGAFAPAVAAGLVGMGIGSACAGIVADRFGRRRDRQRVPVRHRDLRDRLRTGRHGDRGAALRRRPRDRRRLADGHDDDGRIHARAASHDDGDRDDRLRAARRDAGRPVRARGAAALRLARAVLRGRRVAARARLRARACVARIAALSRAAPRAGRNSARCSRGWSGPSRRAPPSPTCGTPARQAAAAASARCSRARRATRSRWVRVLHVPACRVCGVQLAADDAGGERAERVGGGTATAYNLGGVIGALLCAWTIAHAGSRWPLVLCSIGGAASAVADGCRCEPPHGLADRRPACTGCSSTRCSRRCMRSARTSTRRPCARRHRERARVRPARRDPQRVRGRGRDHHGRRHGLSDDAGDRDGHCLRRAARRATAHSDCRARPCSRAKELARTSS